MSTAAAVLPASAIKRLTKDYKYIVEHPSPNLRAHPTNDNIFLWYFVFIGPPDTPYANGQYFGSILFPNNYPNYIPTVVFYTPNGRFETNKKICLQFADKQYWNPKLSVNAVLLGIVTFMCTSDGLTIGWVKPDSEARIKFAKESKRTNCETIKLFKIEFPELYERNKKELENNVELEEELPLPSEIITSSITSPLMTSMNFESKSDNDHDNLGKTVSDTTTIAKNTSEKKVKDKKNILSKFVSKLVSKLRRKN